MIILLTGANGFAIRQTLDTLVGNFLNKNGAHALERVDGESFDVLRLPELLQGASLFASERLVLLRDASKNKPLWEALGEWTDRVPKEVVLVLIETAPDKRTRTYKQLQKHGRIQDFADMSEPELARWAVKTAAEQGATLDPRAAAYLIQQIGTDQWRLSNEIEKLIAYNPVITTESINAMIEPSPQATAFELLDAALGGNVAKTHQLLARLKASEDPYKLFGLLVSQVQTLALVASAQGKPAEAIAKEAGIHPFVVRKMQSAARRIQGQRLKEVIAAVARVDTQMKSTGIDPWILLAQCLGKIAA